MGHLTLLIALALAGSGKAPAWFDRSVAGYALQYDETHGQAGIHDPKTNYYLLRSIECDGAHLTVILTRDRTIMTSNGYRVPNFKDPSGAEGYTAVVEKPLSSLSTSKGVRIGDTPSQVKARLGKPTEIKTTGSRKQFVELDYVWRDIKNGEGHIWTNSYTFKQGKLIEITFNREMYPEE